MYLLCPFAGAPGPPGEPYISRYGSALTIHWSSGDPGRAPISRYVIEARPSGLLWGNVDEKIPMNKLYTDMSGSVLKEPYFSTGCDAAPA